MALTGGLHPKDRLCLQESPLLVVGIIEPGRGSPSQQQGCKMSKYQKCKEEATKHSTHQPPRRPCRGEEAVWGP